jgi:hypothetical protein
MNKRSAVVAAVLIAIFLIATTFALQRSVRMKSLYKSQTNQLTSPSQPLPKQGIDSQGPSVEKVTHGASLVLQGTPRGGEIRIWVKGRDLKIRSATNESTEQLAQKIAEVINADPELHTYGISARASNNEVVVAVSQYWLFLCTTDTGLNVPPAPKNFRARRHDGNLVDLTWQVPKGGYDSVHVLRGTLPVGDDMAGSATRFSDFLNADDKQTYYVFGVKGRNPSCGAEVVVSAQ